ncbi:MAG: hypothetical protein HGA54_09145, partial [Actinobacteria bacterium]|nr:hypothetical protein [Actinomycetota bacterium]
MTDQNDTQSENFPPEANPIPPVPTQQSVRQPAPQESPYQHAAIPTSPVITPQPVQKKPSKIPAFLAGLLGVFLGLILGGIVVGVLASNYYKGITVEQTGSAAVVSTDSSGTITITPSTEDMTLAEAVSSKALPSVVSIDVYMVDSQLSGPGSGSSESVLAGLGSGIII